MLQLPALQSRNYRLFFIGQLFSLFGTWMQQIAMVWLAYRISDSTAVLGLVGFASQIPILLFGAMAGVWNDRFARRRILLVTQSLSMLQALLLFTLAASGHATPGRLVALAFVLGCINAVDMPARQAFVAELVEHRDHLPNAISLNSLLMNVTRFAGPALAGVIIAATDETVCFIINALSYASVLAALLAIRVATRPAHHEPALAALRAGLTYATRHPQIRRSLLMVAGFSLCVTPYTVLLPAFARDVYAGGADTYGFLVGSAGFGSLLAATFLALRSGHRQAEGLDRLVARAMLASGAVLSVFIFAGTLFVAYPLLACLGFSVVVAASGSNTLIQMHVDDNYRGRVMAIFSAAFLGVAPIGSLIVGSVAEQVGVRPTLFICGLVALSLGISHLRQLQQEQRDTSYP